MATGFGDRCFPFSIAFAKLADCCCRNGELLNIIHEIAAAC
jgi:hypothetical protein